MSLYEYEYQPHRDCKVKKYIKSHSRRESYATRWCSHAEYSEPRCSMNELEFLLDDVPHFKQYRHGNLFISEEIHGETLPFTIADIVIKLKIMERLTKVGRNCLNHVIRADLIIMNRTDDAVRML